jgi:hypothetical protein
MKQINEYSIAVLSTAKGKFLEPFKAILSKVRDNGPEALPQALSDHMEPIIIYYEDKIEKLMQDIENLKRQIKS